MFREVAQRATDHHMSCDIVNLATITSSSASSSSTPSSLWSSWGTAVVAHINELFDGVTLFRMQWKQSSSSPPVAVAVAANTLDPIRATVPATNI
jgi:hypothetical protein